MAGGSQVANGTHSRRGGGGSVSSGRKVGLSSQAKDILRQLFAVQGSLSAGQAAAVAAKAGCSAEEALAFFQDLCTAADQCTSQAAKRAAAEAADGGSRAAGASRSHAGDAAEAAQLASLQAAAEARQAERAKLAAVLDGTGSLRDATVTGQFASLMAALTSAAVRSQAAAAVAASRKTIRAKLVATAGFLTALEDWLDDAVEQEQYTLQRDVLLALSPLQLEAPLLRGSPSLLKAVRQLQQRQHEGVAEAASQLHQAWQRQLGGGAEGAAAEAAGGPAVGPRAGASSAAALLPGQQVTAQQQQQQRLPSRQLSASGAARSADVPELIAVGRRAAAAVAGGPSGMQASTTQAHHQLKGAPSRPTGWAQQQRQRPLSGDDIRKHQERKRQQAQLAALRQQQDGAPSGLQQQEGQADRQGGAADHPAVAAVAQPSSQQQQPRQQPRQQSRLSQGGSALLNSSLFKKLRQSIVAVKASTTLAPSSNSGAGGSVSCVVEMRQHTSAAVAGAGPVGPGAASTSQQQGGFQSRQENGGRTPPLPHSPPAPVPVKVEPQQPPQSRQAGAAQGPSGAAQVAALRNGKQNAALPVAQPQPEGGQARKQQSKWADSGAAGVAPAARLPPPEASRPQQQPVQAQGQQRPHEADSRPQQQQPPSHLAQAKNPQSGEPASKRARVEGPPGSRDAGGARQQQQQKRQRQQNDGQWQLQQHQQRGHEEQSRKKKKNKKKKRKQWEPDQVAEHIRSPGRRWDGEPRDLQGRWQQPDCAWQAQQAAMPPPMMGPPVQQQPQLVPPGPLPPHLTQPPEQPFQQLPPHLTQQPQPQPQLLLPLQLADPSQQQQHLQQGPGLSAVLPQHQLSNLPQQHLPGPPPHMAEQAAWQPPEDLELAPDRNRLPPAFGEDSREAAARAAERHQEHPAPSLLAPEPLPAPHESQWGDRPQVLPYLPVPQDDREEEERRLRAAGWRPPDAGRGRRGR